ncbi:phosphoribosylformylglycinamidine synthase subunit PurL [Siccirubricoccus sp. KC 17139]|uniref:Phosphoribosylformylglycinamidine synthase subunit PurL n=1 Tax=Siccirubricoccus soli TaxID=2899147 RepID=A0ABT1D235_9PROT|nr:phosphoribosylformylglycinamidine synthase subunit PurL [Siccirubricoccus soli]MCO6415983.1 phosphoribosylformylglycinamidine synthase subunit PurL [Siccirubricoccus soli]MCP2682115.1 phosphoribosylformylglycinamidine synthase subunit PurL [Siccirubricoccus soli]
MTQTPAPLLPERAAQLAAEFGLKPDEYDRVLAILGRSPSLTELGVFSVMWSEHCSYKSSRVWLRGLPTKAPWVIHGPGENAGVIDIGDGLAAIFKMESHNHPSFIEPYQGAATGVGGILRDVFTMGARPIANLNALRFGMPEAPRMKRVIDGVVRGIGGYGNCVGVPTVGGEVNFHPAYNGNPLVNAMTVGIAPKDRIFLSAAAGIGNPVVYVGSKTGRDGIHGATMASAEFSSDSEEKRPTVQIGDPFVEKLLIEACLELMATDMIVAIQDMGAAGLTSSSVEMAGKGGVGIELVLDNVPQREAGMSAYEMMLSESQERMLMILKPGREAEAEAIFRKWELDFAVIGHLTDTGRITIRHQGKLEADIPLAPLESEAPLYRRPTAETPKQKVLDAAAITDPVGPAAALETLVGSLDLCSRRWIWDQYDSMVGGQTARRPGAADAAVVRVEESLEKGGARALAMTTDCTPRYCAADPEEGGKQAVAEAWRNLTAVGARPLAITDNMNFGNPEKPEIMGQFAAAVRGMAAACTALDFPVVSGNVSLYNETEGRAILPTPAIGGVGVLEQVGQAVGLSLTPGLDLVLIGETRGWLGQSLWLREIAGREEGAPPPVDLAAERRNGDFVRARILAGEVRACHDLSDGGLLVGLAEMAMAGGCGATLLPIPAGLPAHAFWFGEDQGRYVLAVADGAALLAAAAAAGVPAMKLGRSGGEALALAEGPSISVASLRAAHEATLPALMAES